MPAPTPTPRRAALAFIYVTALLDMLAFGLAIPVLPVLYEELSGGETHRAAEMAGFFGLAFAAMQLVFGPVLGSLSDGFGRRPVILLSNFGLAADYALMALAPSLVWLFVGRVLAGITSASFSTASAYIADTAPPEKRAQAFGMLGALFSVGFILGPALGGELGEANRRLPFWIAAGLSLANALYGLLVLPESLPRELRSPFSWRRANPVGSIGLLRSSPVLLGLARRPGDTRRLRSCSVLSTPVRGAAGLDRRRARPEARLEARRGSDRAGLPAGRAAEARGATRRAGRLRGLDHDPGGASSASTPQAGSGSRRIPWRGASP